MTKINLFVSRNLLKAFNIQKLWCRLASDAFPIRTHDPFLPEVSEVIDVRSPEEYSKDHIPGAINLPVLFSSERHDVGKLYSQSPFEARKRGAQLVSMNISEHINNHIKDKPTDYVPLVYCFRGGQRSHSLAIVLSQIGFKVYVLNEGYRAYRRKVYEELEVLPKKFKYGVIAGMTGSGKTHLLSELSKYGEQVLDLEGLAKHKGSVLGLWYQDKQPTQKMFESLIYNKLTQFDERKTVWLESESCRIGNLWIPNVLFQELCHANRFTVNLPLEERVNYIIRDYDYFIQNFDLVKQQLQKLRKIRGNAKIDEWISLGENNKWAEFVEQMLVHHYDPTYTLSQTKNNLSKSSTDIFMDDLSDIMVQKALSQMMEISRENIQNRTKEPNDMHIPV